MEVWMDEDRSTRSCGTSASICPLKTRQNLVGRTPHARSACRTIGRAKLRNIATNQTIEDVLLFANDVAALAWRHIGPACCSRSCFCLWRSKKDVFHTTWFGNDDRNAWSRLNILVRSLRRTDPARRPACWKRQPVSPTDHCIAAATKPHRDICRRHMFGPE